MTNLDQEKKQLSDRMTEIGFKFHHEIPSVLYQYRMVFYNKEYATPDRLVVDVTMTTTNNKNVYIVMIANTTYDFRLNFGIMDLEGFNNFIADLFQLLSKYTMDSLIQFMRDYNMQIIT